MQVKKRNLLEMLLQILTLLLLFVPGTFTWERWVWDKDASTIGGKVIYHGVMTLEEKKPISIFSLTTDSTAVMKIVGLVTAVVMVVTLIFMCRQFLSQGEKSNRKSVPVLSVLSFLLLVGVAAASTFAMREFAAAEFRYTLGWMFYPLAAISLATMLVSIIGYRRAIQLGILAENTVPSGASGSNADELLKYKKLLDDGVISEEEFAQMKQKLL